MSVGVTEWEGVHLCRCLLGSSGMTLTLCRSHEKIVTFVSPVLAAP